MSSLHQRIAPLKTKVLTNQATLWKPSFDINYTKYNEWISISENNKNIKEWKPNLKVNDYPEQTIHCKKLDLQLTNMQETILKRWCKASVQMYNAALYFIKNNYKETGKTITNFKTLRTKHLKNIRDAIKDNSYVKEYGEKTKVKTHMLDGAIKLVCASYKSALSNLKAGNIKHFRIRYIRKKRFMRLEIEPCYIQQNGICPIILKEMKGFYDGEEIDWTTINTTCQLQYDSENDKFSLFVPEKSNTQSHQQKQPWVALDPGIRTFLTGLSDTNVLQIGENIGDKIKKLKNKINHTEKQTFSKKKKRKKRKRIQSKIENTVKDLHWKSINYLVKNYEHVLIGNMSTKSIVRGKKTGLNSITKQSAYLLSFYAFRQRLEFKAQQHHSTVHHIDEAYTTKMCSCCGWINLNIGSSKTLICEKCTNINDRDVDAARCIAFQGLF